MSEFIQVVTTAASKSDIERMANFVVEHRLAACAQQIGPIESTYWWKGKIEKSQEWLLVMKSTKDAYPVLEKNIKSLHPYENPQIVALPIVCGSQDYLNWLKDEVRIDFNLPM